MKSLQGPHIDPDLYEKTNDVQVTKAPTGNKTEAALRRLRHAAEGEDAAERERVAPIYQRVLFSTGISLRPVSFRFRSATRPAHRRARRPVSFWFRSAARPGSQAGLDGQVGFPAQGNRRPVRKRSAHRQRQRDQQRDGADEQRGLAGRHRPHQCQRPGANPRDEAGTDQQDISATGQRRRAGIRSAATAAAAWRSSGWLPFGRHRKRARSASNLMRASNSRPRNGAGGGSAGF